MEEEKEVEVLKEKAPKKKGNGGLIVVIIILLLVIGGLGGFIFANKDNLFSKKDDKEEKEEKKTKKEEKEEEIAIDDSRFITIYNKLKGYTYNQNRENGYKSFTDAELGNIGGTDLVKDDFTILDETTEWGDHFYTFKSDSIIKYLKNYFASDVTFNAEALNNGQTALIVDKVSDNGSGMSIVSYDSSTKTYKVRFGGIGWTSGPQAEVTPRKITKAVLKEDTITVTEKAIYYEDVNVNDSKIIYNIYSDPSKKILIESKEYTIDEVSNQKISVDSYLDKASTITSTYKLNKDTNKYYFVNSVIK